KDLANSQQLRRDNAAVAVPGRGERRIRMRTASKPRLTREQIHEALWSAVAKEADRDAGQIQPGHRVYQDIGIDSLGAVEIQMNLELQLEVSIPDDWLENQEVTMAQLEAALCERLLR